MKDINFEKWLEERFVSFRDVNGTPITKENFQEMFDAWLADMEVDNLISWADLYAKESYLRGQSEVIGQVTEQTDIIKREWGIDGKK
jgi:hypothetical protein